MKAMRMVEEIEEQVHIIVPNPWIRELKSAAKSARSCGRASKKFRTISAACAIIEAVELIRFRIMKMTVCQH
jgi:hypothetical protein